jgi:hypothetical protein
VTDIQDMNLTPFIIAFGTVAIGVLVILAIRNQLKIEAARRAAYAALAAEWGLRYRERPPERLDQAFPGFECFAQGHSRRINHLLEGRVKTPDGHSTDLLAGEWTYKITTSNGKSTSTTTYEFGFLILGPGLGAWPGLQVRRENLLDKFAGALGWDDIDFESVEFSKKFHVKSGDKRFAYDLLDPRMIELFLIADSIPQVDLAGEHFCLHYSRSTRLEPPMLKLLVQWGVLFVDRIPRVVRAGLAEGRYGGSR